MSAGVVGAVVGIFVALAVAQLWPHHITVTENGRPCQHPKTNVWVCP
jgi:hypothetical protein